MTYKNIPAILALVVILSLGLVSMAAAQEQEMQQGNEPEAGQMETQEELQKDVQKMQEIGEKLTAIKEDTLDSNPELQKELEDFQKTQEELQEKGEQLQKDIEAAMLDQDPETEGLLEEYTEIRQKLQPFMQ
ncbi:MAG: hypothetical protein ACLFMP_03140 [Desulfonatronovibrionaceae bacterium]